MSAQKLINPMDLYKAKAGRVDVVDVPQLLITAIDGVGDPSGAEYQAAIGALYQVAYTAKFMLKAKGLEAPKVLPLETLWDMPPKRRQDWTWTAFLVHLAPMDTATLKSAIKAAMAKNQNPALDQVIVRRFKEGRCAQTLYVGPFEEVGPAIEQFHAALAAQSLLPSGRHHEIYLSDPRRTAREKLRTILRTPVAAL